MDKQNEKGMVDLLNQEMKKLQDNQKRIEELSKDIKEIAADWTVSCEYSCDNCPYGNCRNKIAAFLIKAGYRKITENEVVLTREEYEKLDLVKEMYGCEDKVKVSDILNMLKYTDKTARKETAEKFAQKSKQRLSDKLHRGKALHTTVFGKEYVKRIFKEVVDEICKEIVEGVE